MTRPVSLFAIFSLLLFCGISAQVAAQQPGGAKVDFAHDVQPLLRRHCDRCHGSKNQEGGLQLNLRAAALGQSDSGVAVIVKGDADASLLIQRIVSDEHGDTMPLDGDRVPKAEVEILKRWIQQGANWPDALADAKHWAYQPISRPTLPADSDSVVDHFVEKRLKQVGLRFMAPADRARLIRRVSLALTGVPPTPIQVQEFVNDDSPKAYERVVDRLLQSPRFGERWAGPWLDLARYADSNGFQADQIRDNWAYRDWVIRALNRDMPVNQFVIEQLAGDLLEDATTDQKIATGFHRMTTCNVEAGVDPEANRVNQVVDRVNTTATVFLGSTLECAQCHDHKYDPFTQKDYYQLFAYFNNTPLEVKNTSGVTWDFFGPTMDLPMGETSVQQREELLSEQKQLEQRRKVVAKASDKEFEVWLNGLRDSVSPEWIPVVPDQFVSSGNEEYKIEEDGSVLLSGSVPDTVDHQFTLSPEVRRVTAIRVEALADESIPGMGPGRGDAKRSNLILSEVTCEVITEDRVTEISLQDAVADFSQKGWDVGRAIDGNRKTGWAIAPQFGKSHWASFVLSVPAELDTSGSRMRVTLGQYYGRGRVIGKPRISVFVGDPNYLHVDDSLRKLAGKAKLNNANKKKLRAEFDKNNPKLREVERELDRVSKALAAVEPETTLVMVEMEEPRETFVMIRGDYENLDARVNAAPPEVLPQAESIERTGDRLELARRITSHDNPLFPRVTVNRWWGEIFGTGIVNTPEDFGTQAESPSHPELLDWLASGLIKSNWSMKHVLKLMVMSKSFQQSSRIEPERLKLDPNNRLLSRGPRFRLSAELMRDSALAISGLLSEKMYGPPIMPFQPDDIWRSVGRNQPKWKSAEDNDRFRRGVYVVWKRAAPYPSFITFDAPDRGSCTVSRGRTNTPLQALTLLNDPAYAEMALAFADRVLSESPSSDTEARIRYAVSLALAREATPLEIRVIGGLLNSERKTLAESPEMAAERTKVPFRNMSLRSVDRKELAAWFAVTNAILNLDETMSQ